MTPILLIAFGLVAAFVIWWAWKGAASVMADKEPRIESTSKSHDASVGEYLIYSSIMNATMHSSSNSGDAPHLSHDHHTHHTHHDPGVTDHSPSDFSAPDISPPDTTSFDAGSPDLG